MSLLNKTGLLLLLIPIGLLLLFTFGEVFSGDLSGFSHLLQLLPFILVSVLAWKKPYIGGGILLVASLSLGILYYFAANLPWQTIILVETLLFVPPLVAGILLMIGGNKKDTTN